MFAADGVASAAEPDSPTAEHYAAQAGPMALRGKLLSVMTSGFVNDVWTFSSDGSNGQNLTAGLVGGNGAKAFVGYPIWSRDGSKIAFSASFLAPSEVWVMNPDGTSPVRVTTVSGGESGSAVGVVWSPSGDRIGFARAKGGQAYTIRIDGSDEKPIPGVGWIEASWSPNSELLVYRANSNDPLLLVKSDGTSKTALPTAADAAEPQWSADGEWIAYTQCFDPPPPGFGCSDPADREVRVIRPDGTGDRMVVRNAFRPTWSPDGSSLLFQRMSDEFITGLAITRLFEVSIESGAITEIVLDRPAETSTWDPAFWQPILLSDRPPVVGLVDPSQGLWHLFDDAGAVTTQFFFGNPGDYPIVGDWDCDGVETPGMYRQSDGYVYLRNSNTQGAADIRFFFGDPGDVPIAGDFNNDGCDTVSIYRPANQTFYIINELGKNDGGLGAAEFSYVFGDPGDKPFVGDFDGDSVETVGLHRESTGLVYFRNSHTQGVADAQFIFGDPGDRLVAGDWNNDGKYSPALFRPSNTTMFFRYTNTQGNADNQFIPAGSQPGWLPVAGVFNK